MDVQKSTGLVLHHILAYLIQGAFMRDIKFGLEGIVLSYILFGDRGVGSSILSLERCCIKLSLFERQGKVQYGLGSYRYIVAQKMC